MAVRFISPMLCKLLAKPFDDPTYVFEKKLDGVRIIATKAGSQVRLWTRNKIDRSLQFPEITQAIRSLPAQQLILDGELVATTRKLSFQAIQPRVHQTNPAAIARMVKTHPVIYHVFDLLHLNGQDYLSTPLLDRKKLLKPFSTSKVKYLPHIPTRGKALFAKAKQLGWEGVIGKLAKGRYLPGKRLKDWVKIKTHGNQEFVIAGYTQGRGATSKTFGALLVGYYRNGKLKLAGDVGTGYTEAERKRLRQLMDQHKVMKSSFTPIPKALHVTWLKPVLVGQFKFAEWTKSNILRVPVYLGLRDDKPAKLVKQEK